MNKYVKLIVEEYLKQIEKGEGVLGFTKEQIEEIKNELQRGQDVDLGWQGSVKGLLKSLKFSK